MTTAPHEAPAAQTEQAATQPRFTETVAESPAARMYDEVRQDERKVGSDTATETAVSAGGTDADLMDLDIGKRDSKDKGMTSMEIGAKGTEITYNSTQRDDKLLYSSQKDSPHGKSSLEIFGGRADGIAQQTTTTGADGSLSVERKYSPGRADGLLEESFDKSKTAQTIEKKFDPSANDEKLAGEKISKSSLGSVTERTFEGRIDGVVSTSTLSTPDGSGSERVMYQNGLTVEHPLTGGSGMDGGDKLDDADVPPIEGGSSTPTPTKDGDVKPEADVTKPPEWFRGGDSRVDGGISGSDSFSQQFRSKEAPLLQPENFATTARELLTRLDTNNTGRITRDQIARAMEDPTITGVHAQALAAMHKNFNSLANMGGNLGLLDSRSISAADLTAYDNRRQQQAQQQTDATTLTVWGRMNLNNYSRTGNGVTRMDVDRALASPQTSQFDRDQLTYLRNNFSQIAGSNLGWVTPERLDQYQRSVFDSPQAQLQSNLDFASHRVQRSQAPGVVRDLYATPNPRDSISPEAITQGMIGNCYLASALSSVAQSNPELIQNAIRDNRDGTYTVTFPGAREYPVTVKAPTEAEQGLYNAGSQHGLWASVMEKAAGELYNQGIMARILGRSWTPTEGSDGGGNPGNALTLLTGNSYDSVSSSPSTVGDVRRQLMAAFSGNPPASVVAGTDHSFFSNESEAGYARRHAYSILGFNPEGPGGGTVTVRNPWNGSTPTSGRSEIPLDVFVRNFERVWIQRRR